MSQQARPAAKFGAFSLTCLVVANTIGAGVYTTSGFTLADMGTPEAVLWVWLLAALLAFSGAMSFAALAKALPLSGGEYVFLSRLLHPAAGFIAGWVSLVAGFAGAQAYGALAMTEYLNLPSGLAKGLTVTLLIGLAVTHGKLVTLGTALQNVAVAAKAAFLVVFIAVGWWALPEEIAVASSQSGGAAATGLSVWAFNVLMVGLSFTGFNAAIYVAEECHNPRRDIPRALLTGTVITALLYLAVNAVFVYSAPSEQLAGSPRIAMLAAEALGGAGLAQAVQWLVLLSLFTLISGAAVSGPRVVQKMGEDGFLPPLTLAQASALQCALCVTMTLFSDLLSQLEYLSLTLSLTSALTVSTVFRLPPSERPWLLFPLIYVAGTLLTSAVALWRTPLVGSVALATIVVGLLLYLRLKPEALSSRVEKEALP